MNRHKSFKQIAFLSLCFFIVSTISLPIISLISVIAYAETIIYKNKEENTKEFLTTSTNFLFTKDEMQGEIGNTLNIDIQSDQETNEVFIQLPPEAIIDKTSLSDGVTIEEFSEKNTVGLRSAKPQKLYTLPVSFNQEGIFELTAGMSTIKIKVSQPDNVNLENNDYNNNLEGGENSLVHSNVEDEDNTNFFQNPSFLFERGKDTTIPSWELVSTTTPVNLLTRNLNISLETSDDGWNRLSDGSFSLGGTDYLQVRRWSGTRTFIITQSFNTVRNQRYRVRINAKTLGTSGTLIMTAYNRRGLIAGPSGQIGGMTYTLTNEYSTYEMIFTADSEATAIGFRINGDHVAINNAHAFPEQYGVSVEASPPTGGNPVVENSNLLLGERTTINANPNPEYDFVRWEVISGIGSDVQPAYYADSTFIMGHQNTVLRAIYEPKKSGRLYVQYLDEDGHELAERCILEGLVGETYQTFPRDIEHYNLINVTGNTSGVFTEDTQYVYYTYSLEAVKPVDPLSPDDNINPESPPNLPIDQGLLSIDFVSQFDFGIQAIFAQDKNYYASPQHLLNSDGTVNENEQRPNYIQISDRRPKSGNWELSVSQKGQFSTNDGYELKGASIQFENQQLGIVNSGDELNFESKASITLIPNTKKILFENSEGRKNRTWIYRFGNHDTADRSIKLNIPKGANPHAVSYKTELVWELSSVPSNEIN